MMLCLVFLGNNSEEHISGKYLAALKNPEAAKGQDFSKLVYDHFLTSINHFNMVGKTKGRRMRAPLCCYYVSVVRYLDCLDFGRLDCGVFTMKCLETWKPFVDLRKLFSEQDILNIRVQYAIRMYFHSHNETDMSLVLDYYTQV